MDWDFVCPDWQDRLRTGRALVPDLPLDLASAERAVRVFNKLRLPDVVGQPPMAEAAGDWFRDIVRALFGSLDDDGLRHVPEIFALVPKKQSKTTGGAGIMVTALLENRRPRAEFLLVGPTQEIADLAFAQASGMIAADPEGYLQKRFKVHDHVKTIKDLKNESVLKIKTFDMQVMTGAIPTGVLVDELHIMSAKSYAARVIGQIRGGLASRPDGFLLFITTQSDQPPAGVFKAELQLARGIRDGRVRDDAATMLPILYEFPREMQLNRQWEDPRNWPMVLPNLDRSVSMTWLVKGFAQAREKGEGELRRWVSQHLNVEIGVALDDDNWAGASHWEAASESGLTLDELLARCDVVTAGIDGGGLDDLLGLAILGRERDTKRWLLWVKAWAQTDVLERRKNIVEVLTDFQDQGDLVICDDATQDLMEVADILERIHDLRLFPVKQAIGLDPQGVAAMVDELATRGIDGDMLVAVPQGYRLTGAILGSERKLKDGTLRHCGQPLMAWCVGNAKVEQRGNAILITKQTAGKAKIDPLMAAFNAVSLMSRNPMARGHSVYGQRGMLVV